MPKLIRTMTQTPHSPTQAWVSLCALGICLFTAIPTWANAALGPTQLQAIAQKHLEARSANLPGKVSVSVSTPRLPNTTDICSAAEASESGIPRRWGKANVNLRCTAGANWSIYVSATIRVDGAWVISAQPLRSGQTVDASDIRMQQGELSAQPIDVLTDPAQAIGFAMRQSMNAGTALRNTQLREAFTVVAGQDIKIITNGPGFTVSNDGKALHNAFAGQNLRAKTRNGQSLSGTLNANGTLEVAF